MAEAMTTPVPHAETCGRADLILPSSIRLPPIGRRIRMGRPELLRDTVDRAHRRFRKRETTTLQTKQKSLQGLNQPVVLICVECSTDRSGGEGTLMVLGSPPGKVTAVANADVPVDAHYVGAWISGVAQPRSAATCLSHRSQRGWANWRNCKCSRRLETGQRLETRRCGHGRSCPPTHTRGWNGSTSHHLCERW